MATTTNNGWVTPDNTAYVKDGASAIRSLGQSIDTSVGTGLLAWQTYTPVLQGGFSGGNGVWVGRFCQIGKTVHVNAYFIFGSTTVKGAAMDVSLPVTAANSAAQINSNSFCSISGNLYPLPLVGTTTSLVRFKTVVTNGTYGIFNDVTATTPATWVTNDVLYFGLTYQAA